MSCQTSEVAATMSAPTEIQKARRAYLILDSFTLLPVRFPLSDFFEGMAAIGVNRTEVLGLSNMEIATADSDPDMLIREQPVYTRPILPG